MIEIAGIGPGPFCAMMLADMGADVVRVDRASAVRGGDPDRPPLDLMARGRRSIGVDLKASQGLETVLSLVEGAEALLEGFRPGVGRAARHRPRRLPGPQPGSGVRPHDRLGPGRPYASAAGHDINYISLAGVLHAIGRAGQAPVPPLNLVGDFGGGGMYLAFGMVCALLEARTSGQGQVVGRGHGGRRRIADDLHVRDKGLGHVEGRAGHHMLDTGAHFYDVYETSDGRHISLGPIEPQFYAELRELLGLEGPSGTPSTTGPAGPTSSRNSRPW